LFRFRASWDASEKLPGMRVISARKEAQMRFHVKVTVTQLRVLILVVNFLLAAGIPSYAVYGFFAGGRSHAEPVEIVDVARLRMQPDVLSPGPSGAQGLAEVWSKLTEKVEVIEPTKKPEESPREGGAGKRGDLESGPLGQSWDYVIYILREAPRKNMVIL